jgi:hypothetical protein
MKKYLSLLFVAILVGGLFTTCKKDKGDPPVLPPEESMLIDFSNFESGKSGDITELKGVEDSYWAFSALVAGYFRAYITTTLAIPVAAFTHAIDHTPAYLEEKTWQWSFDVPVLSMTYKARLTGQIRTADVLWKMYISRTGTGSFPEFLWFEGTSKLDGTGGTWSLNHSYAQQVPILTIDWTRSGSVVNKVTYTYVKAGDEFNTSYIEYGKEVSGIYDAYYDIHYYNGVEFVDVDVKWSRSTYAGTVMCNDFFGDSEWHCWNSSLINLATCP